MRVVIDARALGDASSYRGIGTYVRNLLSRLPSNRIEVAALATAKTPLPKHVARVTVRRWAPDRLASPEHDLRLPKDLARGGPDVAHSPALDPPRRSPGPWVQTVHDVIPLDVDHVLLAAERRRWDRYRPRFQRADAIVAVSQHSAERAIHHLDLDAKRVTVIHHGVDPAFRPARPEDGSVEEDPPFVLYVGEFAPHKGHREAFDVMGRLAAAGHPHHLKVAGRIAPWHAARMRELRDRSPRPDRVELLGFVQDLSALYRSAAVLVFSSRYEGFGLPVVEAMASGLPVVAFANTAVTEIVGGGGVLVPDGDLAAMAEAVSGLLADGHLRATQRSAGLRRAEAFDWEQAVARHADVYRAVA